MISFSWHRDCTLCPMHTEAQSIGIPMEWVPSSLPTARENPAVVAIGQNPGSEEDKAGSNFISSTWGWARRPSAGKTLREAYFAGIDLEDRACIYLANGARCGPRSTNAAGVYNACAPYLISDLTGVAAYHKRRALLFVSAPAIKAFFKLHDISVPTLTKALGMQGTEVEVGAWGDAFTCFFSYHPAYLNRGNFRLIRSVHRHNECLSRWLDGTQLASSTLELTPAAPPTGDAP